MRKTRENVFYKYKSDLNTLLKSLNKNIKILEIGFGNGNFANFCKEY